MKFIIVSLAACLLLVGCETTSETTTEAAGPVCGHVLSILDGKTISVDIDGEATTVRLIGVDTGHASTPEAAEATTFLTEFLRGKTVELVTDAEHGETDREGRMLAYVYRESDGMFVNAEIVRAGFGVTDMEYTCRYTPGFRMLERAAQKQGTEWVATETSSSDDSDNAGVMFAGRPDVPAPDPEVRTIPEPEPEPSAAAIKPIRPVIKPIVNTENADTGELFPGTPVEGAVVTPEPETPGIAPVLRPVITEEAVVPPVVVKPLVVTVYVTDGRLTYHSGDCTYLWKGKTAKPLAEARKAYTPCDRCNPPK